MNQIKIDSKSLYIIVLTTIITLIVFLSIPLYTKPNIKKANLINLTSKNSIPYSVDDKVKFLLNKYQDLNYQSYNLVGNKYLVLNTTNKNIIYNIYNNKEKLFADLFKNNDLSLMENLIVNTIKQKYPDFISGPALDSTTKRTYTISNDIQINFENVITNPVYEKPISVVLTCQMIQDIIDYKCIAVNHNPDVNKPDLDKVIAITFDDGPSKYTPEILKTLAANNATATFFMLGAKLSSNSNLVKEVLKAGHEIGHHSYSHKYLTEISETMLDKEINETNAIYHKITNKDLLLIRPPYGSINTQIRNKYNYAYILWSIDSNDWKHKNVTKTVKTVLANPQDGDIILLHDTYASSAAALKIILPELYLKGFKVVTVTQLAAQQTKEIKAHQLYRSFK